MPVGMFATENLRVCPQNGDACISTLGRVTQNMILISDVKIPLRIGDTVERSLPSGIVERFLITDPGYHEGTGHGIPSHYQAKYRRPDATPARSASPAIHVSGDHARINVGSADHSTNSIQYLSAAGESGELVTELRALRQELLARAGDEPERYVTIGAVATAETAASEGNEAKAGSMLRSLGKAGGWALTIAKELGLRVASDYLGTYIG